MGKVKRQRFHEKAYASQHETHTLHASCPPIINDTITFWQEKTGRTLTQEEAREAIENISGFFQILYEWEQAEQLEDI